MSENDVHFTFLRLLDVMYFVIAWLLLCSK